MKKLFLLLFLCVCAKAYSQEDADTSKKQINKKINSGILPVDSITKLITYSEVVYLNDSISKNELFSRAKSAFAVIYKNSILILNEDRDAGVISAQGTIQATVTFLGEYRDAGVINFTLTLSCKDGKYRYILTDFVFQEENTSRNLNPLNKPADLSINQWKELKNNIHERMKKLIATIKTEMNKPSAQYDKW